MSTPHRLPLLSSSPPRAFAEVPSWFAPAERLPPLLDAQGRQYRYLRLSVTDRCNMACTYCMPDQGELTHALRRDVLSFEHITRLCRVLRAMGVSRVRLTGGEPLLRKQLPDLISRLREVAGVDDIWLTTNGVRLPDLAQTLRNAGLEGVNLSLDSLQEEVVAAVTRGAALADILAGLDAALGAGLKVKLNTVALRGINDRELPTLARFAWSRGVTPRFIELMPLGEGAALLPEHHLDTGAMLALVSDLICVDAAALRDPGAGPAAYYPARDGSGHRLGIIGAISDNFCEQCNRLRITSRGEMVACVASRTAVPLKALMDANATDRELAWALHSGLRTKAAGHNFLEQPEERHGRGMSLVGG